MHITARRAACYTARRFCMQLIHSLQPFIRPELLILMSVLYVIGRAAKKGGARAGSADPAAVWTVRAVTDCAGYRDVLLALFTALTQGVFVRQLIRQAQKPESSCKFSRTFI